MPDDLKVTSSAPLPDLSVVASGATPGEEKITGISGRTITPGQKFAEEHPTLTSVVEAPAEAMKGVGEAALNSLQGIKELANKALPASAQIPDVPGRTMPGEAETEGLARKAGKLAESVGEFAAGDEALATAGKLANVSAKFPRLVALMDKYPKAYAILTRALKEGAVGATQGAVKGAAEGKAAAGAEGGAIGGALGGAAGEALTIGGRLAMNKMFGATPEEAFTMAARPYMKDVNFEQSATRAIPRIEAAAKNHPFKNVGEFVDLLDEEKNKIWQSEYQPLIAQHQNEIINGAPIARAIRSRKTLGMAALPSVFKGETEEIESIAKDFDNFQLKVPEASEVLQHLNAKLSDYYRMSPADRAAARITDGYLTSLEAAADEIRDQIDKKVGVEGTTLRQDYGAMKDMHRIFARRAMVFNRQAPISLPQALGGIEATAALLAGHPIAALAGAVPFASRWANAPTTLVRRGLALSQPAVRSAAPAALANVGAQVGREIATPEEDSENAQ